MEVKAIISFKNYTQEEIIGFLRDRLVTVDEVIRSGIVDTFASNDLRLYIQSIKHANVECPLFKAITHTR